MKPTLAFLCYLSVIASGIAESLPQLGDANFPAPKPSPRHAEKVAAVKSGDYDLMLIGDSITHSLGELDGKYEPMKAVWGRYYAPYKAINLGHNGYRTEEILWNLQNGELDFARSPKVAMLLIGTNNSDERHFNVTHTAEEIFAGTKAIVELINQRHPSTKILVLRIFPRGGDDEQGVSPPVFNSSSQCIETCKRAGELTKQLADGKQIFWLDVNEVFLNPDGSINTKRMWDLLNPSPAGAESWSRAVEPTLSRLMSGSLVPAIQTISGLHASEPGAATTPMVQRGWEQRHAEKVAAIAGKKFDLLLIGDSITHNVDRAEYRDVWDTFFAPRNANCLGYSGARTENILWNLSHGELEGQSPKVVTLLIGTNNGDDANYKVVHTAEEIAAGTKAIVSLIRKRLPNTKILLLRIFPRTNKYWKPDGTERGSMAKRFMTNQRAGELVADLADDEHIFFLDVNHVFLHPDGSLDPDLMPDNLHPSPKGARVWAEAMEPLLAKMFGDEPRCALPTNNALVPLPKIEDDFYDWWQRHEAVLEIKNDINPDIVLLGDSITHLWGGLPEWEGRAANGTQSFAETFSGKRVLNLGYGYDRIQNVLWRLDHGEVRGLRPKHVVVNIGTNNLWPSKNARGNSVEEIAEGVRAVVLRLRANLPETNIILMGLFPRGEHADDPSRAKIARVNGLLSAFSEDAKVTFLDLGARLTEADGRLSKKVMADFLHPGEQGYQVWGDALAPIIAP